MTAGHDTERFAAGANYSIDVEDGIAVLRVWSRPDLSFDVCAQLAQDKVSHLKRLVSSRPSTGLLLDLTLAAPVIGPRTEEAVVQMLQTFVDQALPVVVVARSDTVRQQMQFERLIRNAAPGLGRVTADPVAARLFLREASTAPRR